MLKQSYCEAEPAITSVSETKSTVKLEFLIIINKQCFIGRDFTNGLMRDPR